MRLLLSLPHFTVLLLETGQVHAHALGVRRRQRHLVRRRGVRARADLRHVEHGRAAVSFTELRWAKTRRRQHAAEAADTLHDVIVVQRFIVVTEDRRNACNMITRSL